MNIDIKNKPLPVEVLIVDPPGVKEGTVVNLLTGKRLLNSAPVVKSLKFRGYHKGDYYVDGDRVFDREDFAGSLGFNNEAEMFKTLKTNGLPFEKTILLF